MVLALWQSKPLQTHERSRQNITLQPEPNSAHLPRLHINQNTVHAAFVHNPKHWRLAVLKTPMFPLCYHSPPHFMCTPALPPSPCLTCVCTPGVCQLVYPFQWKHWDSSHHLPCLGNVVPPVGGWYWWFNATALFNEFVFMCIYLIWISWWKFFWAFTLIKRHWNRLQVPSHSQQFILILDCTVVVVVVAGWGRDLVKITSSKFGDKTAGCWGRIYVGNSMCDE